MEVYPYSFVERSDTDNWVVQIKGGPYEGVCYEYGKISAKTDEDADTATLAFKFNIIEYGEVCEEGIETLVHFNNAIGDILQDVINSAFDDKNYTIGNKKNATNDTDNSTS